MLENYLKIEHWSLFWILCFGLWISVPSIAFGQIVTPHDTIPDFCSTPTKTATNGTWSSSSTWSPPGVPSATDVIQIPSNVTVTYDATTGGADCVGVHGTLIVSRAISTSLKVGNFLIYSDGTLDWGTPTSPIPATITSEIVIADRPLNTTQDPQQYGTGLIALGKVIMHGARKEPTFVRLSQEPKKGDTTLQLEQPVSGWDAGDRLILPDSRHLRDSEYNTNQREEIFIGALSADGKIITLTSPLQYNHLGARDADGAPTILANGTKLLPHIGNWTRNIIIKSENSTGTRGHVLFTDQADIDIRYVLFSRLGRTLIDQLDSTTFDASGVPNHIGTNQIGRYALHTHHLMGSSQVPANGYQFTLVGNAVDDALKWGITLHDSSKGLIQNNVVNNAGGAGIMTEDSAANLNMIEKNFVVATFGNGVRAADNESTNRPGSDGSAFYFHGAENYVRGNVTANNAIYGYTIFGGSSILEFAGNESYGATPSGLTIWRLGASEIDIIPPNQPESIVKDFIVWHVYRHAYFGYPSNRITFDHPIIRGDKDVLRNTYENAVGLYYSDYFTRDHTIRDADIQGMKIGIEAPVMTDVRKNLIGENDGLLFIENSYLRNYVNIVVSTPWTVNGGGGLSAKKNIIRDVRFDSPTGVSPINYTWSPSNIFVGVRTGDKTNYVVPDRVFVYGYNDVADNNFQIFYKEQHPDFVMPQAGNQVGTVACPEDNLTNQQCWDKYGVAIAGAVSPCTPGDPTQCPNALNSPQNDPTGKYTGIFGDVFPLNTPPPNRPPTITLNPNQTTFQVRLGEQLTFQTTPTDPDGDLITSFLIQNLATLFPGARFE